MLEFKSRRGATIALLTMWLGKEKPPDHVAVVRGLGYVV